MSAHHTAVEQSEAPALLVSAELRVSHANAGAHALLGYPPGQLRGLEMAALFQPRRVAELRNFEQLLAGGGARRWRTVLCSLHGQRREVALGLSACVGADGEIEAVHVELEEVSVHSWSRPPRASGFHVSADPHAAPTTRPPAAELFDDGRRTMPPPGPGAPDDQALRVRLEELRSRLVELEARAHPVSEPLPPEERGELLRTAREARALLDEVVEQLGD